MNYQWTRIRIPDSQINAYSPNKEHRKKISNLAASLATGVDEVNCCCCCCCWDVWSPPTDTFFISSFSRNQCSGSMTFWCGSRSADPCQLLMDPEPDPGGPKTCGSGGSIRIRIRIRNTVSNYNDNLYIISIFYLKVHKHEFFFRLFLQKPKPYGPKGL